MAVRFGQRVPLIGSIELDTIAAEWMMDVACASPYIPSVMTELDLSLRPQADSRRNISGLGRAELRAVLAETFDLDEKKARMRANQIWRWVYQHGITDFSQMTDIAKEMRGQLAEHFEVVRPEMIERQISDDGTRKYLLRMGPGIEVECVYIPDVGRTGALCVSSQVGCTLNCTFCHTGTQKLVRNLTTAEIIGQVLAFEGKGQHVVFH